MEPARRTIFKECGALTTFAPPEVSLDPTRVRDERGRTMFVIYEPRYHLGPTATIGRSATTVRTGPAGERDGHGRLLVLGGLALIVALLAASGLVFALALASGS